MPITRRTTGRAPAALCALLWCAAAACAAGGESVPAVTRHVNDYAGVLSAQQADRLEAKLAAHERATSNQIAVVIVRSLGNRDLESLSLAIAEKARLGQKGRDNGVLLFVVMDERKMRIETGRGVEGELPDVVCGRIIRDDIAPLFKENRYYQGIDVGTDRIIAGLGGELAPAYREPAAAPPPANTVEAPLVIGVVIAFIVVLICHYISRLLGAAAGGVAGLIIGFFGHFSSGLGAVPIAVLAGAIFGAFAREILLAILFSRGGRWHSGGGGGGGFSGGGGRFSGGGASGGW